MTEIPKIGQLIEDGERRRDAIHVAIAPVTADDFIRPGAEVQFSKEDDYELVAESVKGYGGAPFGIADPYLDKVIEPGQRFYVFLFPGTVTSLRHVWSHPQFDGRRVPRG